MSKENDELNEAETAQRRDEVIRRMANTPPQHRSTSKTAPIKAKASAGSREPRMRASDRARAKP